MQLFESVSRWLSDNPVVRRSRTGDRVAVERPVHVRINGDAAVHYALLRDVSFGGACIRCDIRLARGDVVWLEVDDEASEPFEFTASVVAVRPNELGFFADYGLRLMEISLPAARALASFIGRRLPANASASRNAVTT
jgi:PilZ domain-containing protein